MSKALEILKHYRAKEVGACSSLYQYGEGNYPQKHTSFSVKAYDEAIAELEAQEAKSCKDCKKQDLPPIEQIMACGHCKQLARDNFEPKDTK